MLGMQERFQESGGAIPIGDGVRFSVWSAHAEQVEVCIFDDSGNRETARHSLMRDSDNWHRLFVPHVKVGARYGLRAYGPYDPAAGHLFDPSKLLMDPYARQIDRPYRYHSELGKFGLETNELMPKAVVCPSVSNVSPPIAKFDPGGLIYELPVKAFSKRNPELPPQERGLLRAIAHETSIAHFQKIGVSAVELMPVTAWIDERHLAPLGLTNAWGYNPVTFSALDPRLAPGGIEDLRFVSDTLHQNGIGVFLDIVFNHTGESDAFGPTLSFRGLDARSYYRRDRSGQLINDTGTGNTFACDQPHAVEMMVDCLRYFVQAGGVDGFRFDLAPILGRTENGFTPTARFFTAIENDPVLRDRIMIAEPWDIGPGGYQLGAFPSHFLEWNDRYRDDVRMFWRGDQGKRSSLATRLSGSSDIFQTAGQSQTRSVNFIAAHDGFSLADIVSHKEKHNFANGEDNRDGHNENLSWNNGAEGASENEFIQVARQKDIKALLATIFMSKGPVMLTAGDEFGRSQHGNNNGYAQDNDITWLDWKGRDGELEDYVAFLSIIRGRFPAIADPTFADRADPADSGAKGTSWLNLKGSSIPVHEWEDGDVRTLNMLHHDPDNGYELAVLINGTQDPVAFALPERDGSIWQELTQGGEFPASTPIHVTGRSVSFAVCYV